MKPGFKVNLARKTVVIVSYGRIELELLSQHEKKCHETPRVVQLDMDCNPSRVLKKMLSISADTEALLGTC